MTAEQEFKGKTVQKAVEVAAKALGIPDDAVRYDIISHGSTGIFGLAGIKKARIKVKGVERAERSAENKLEDLDAETHDAAAPNAATETGGLEESQQMAEAILRRMVDAISPESTISIDTKDRQLRFQIEGGQSSILIGKRGQTLEAMQLILDKAVRRLNGHAIRLQVDVEGYLAKKKAGLVRTAQQLAQKVKTKGSPTTAGYLNAQDRRTVHLALKTDPNVRTQSVGEGPFRKLMIYPKRKPRNKS
ncbi:MAG: KH domain-containing protein [Desulfobacteraceae bacterium]|nr:KH domain-containing protein [Desulfobacteraceae bacterium]MBC2753108.1 Jag N-terminal domain-containing protein [Desulfobacteraceae bacterium]